MKKILLLSASFGDGHRQVANALCESFVKKPNVIVHSIDTFRATNKRVAGWNEMLFETLTRFFPSLYGFSYYATERLRLNHWLWGVLTVFSRKAAWSAVNKYQPDIVIQLFPDHALRRMPIQLTKRPVVAVILTDFAIHSRWFHSGVDIYFLPHAAMVNAAEKWITNRQLWQVTGIPLRHQFANFDLCEHGQEFHHIVIATGGRGVFADLPEVIQSIRKHNPDLQVIVLCGRNESIYQTVQAMGLVDPFITARGFIEEVAPVFREASFAVIKAGGVTIAECIASCCPMVFYKPLPGQEKVNATLCEQTGMGMIIHAKNHINSSFARLTKERIKSMRISCANANRQNAADVIVTQMLNLIP